MSKQLIEAQRYEIYLGIKRGWSISRIAAEIGVSKSTVSREVSRNKKADGEYVWTIAQAKAEARRHVVGGNNRKGVVLWLEVERMITEEQWSPAQIAGVLRKRGVDICKQTIYNHVHADGTGELARHMRHKLKYRHRQKAPRPTKATNIANRTSIHLRPAEADGKRFGDWQMDTIVDSFGHAILTLTETSTNMLIMEKLRFGRRAKPLAKAVARLLFPYKGDGVKTITTDNGCEFAAHLDITKALGATVFFTDSYSSWQKGAIENMNKLVRQYIPKSANFARFSDNTIFNIQKKINRRPREKLNFSSHVVEFFKFFN